MEGQDVNYVKYVNYVNFQLLARLVTCVVSFVIGKLAAKHNSWEQIKNVYEEAVSCVQRR